MDLAGNSHGQDRYGSCPICQTFVFNLKNYYDAINQGQDPYGGLKVQWTFRDQLPDLPGLAQSAKRGCSWCAVLAGSISFESHVRRNEPETIDLKFNTLADQNRNLTMLYSYNLNNADYKSHCSMHMLKSDDRNPFSENNLEIIRSAIKSCVNNHAACPGPELKMSPLRLVNVMDGNMIRLERTDDKSHRYAALSYCWGGSKALEDAKTMGDNIDVRMSGFRLDELPRTLKDAIILTRRLNIQYIWIDAICIVQDCEHEWNNEARKMMHYYGHALVAIVPVDSKSGDCGIDVGNNPPLCCKIPRSWSAISRIGDVLTSSNHSSDEETSEWERRGWTYQEKLNSSRILFVFRHRLRLKCREGFFDTLTHWTDWKSIARESRPTFLPTGSFGMEQKDLWTYWYCIVQFYTTRRLTEPRDRSIALSGITQAFEQGSGCEIIAGMFKDTILLDIVSWTSPDTSPRHSRARQSPTGCPRVHLASLPVCSNCGLPECGKFSDRTDSQESSIPSWTWLATNWSEDGKVVNLAATRVLQESSAKLLSISSVEPFQLRISGAMLSSDEILRHLYYHRKYSRKTYCGGRGFGTAFLDSHGDIYGCMCETEHITSDCKAYDVIGSLSPAASALFMGTHYHNSMPPNGDDIWHFILIQPTEPLGGQEKPLQYRRIGTMHIPGNLFDEGLKNNLKNREWGIIILV